MNTRTKQLSTEIYKNETSLIQFTKNDQPLIHIRKALLYPIIKPKKYNTTISRRLHATPAPNHLGVQAPRLPDTCPSVRLIAPITPHNAPRKQYF